MPPSCPDLLERDFELGRVRAALEAVAGGAGRCLVISGEAGVGKTSLLAAAVAQTGAMRWLRGECDALHMPRPLGPLVDLADSFPQALAQALRAADTANGLFPMLLEALRQSHPPAVLLIEDLQWADEATLDGVRYLGKRIGAAGCALILTLRSDALASEPSLRQTMAALDAAATLHIELGPLSAAAVAEMCLRHGRNPQGMHALTGGNPFYLSQLLAAHEGAVPGPLRDALLVQADALDPVARDAADTLCLSPGGLALTDLLALHPHAADALAEPAAQALLDVQPPWIGFRHDLARLVLHDALPEVRRWQRQQALLSQLQRDRPGLPPSEVQHAADSAQRADSARCDLDHMLTPLYIGRAMALIDLARWDDAQGKLDALRAMSSVPADQAGSAAILRSRIDALQGRTNDRALWQAHLYAAQARRVGLLPAYVAIAAAEAAWLRQDPARALQLARQGLAQAEGPWVVGHLRKWVRLCGGRLPALAAHETLAPPHRAAEDGDWRQAHAIWAGMGCAFEAALALLDGDRAGQRRALKGLIALGADPAVRAARQLLVAAGARGVARGPYGHARADPLGLTRRERQVAELLAASLSNAQIAQRLQRSERTVAHHVSALLSKLGVRNRTQVAGRL